jgi:hypothetical protein
MIYSHSRPVGWVDCRTKEGRLLRDIRAKLVRHVGGTPTPIQEELIERAARLSLRLAQLDEQGPMTGAHGRRDMRHYLELQHEYRATLTTLEAPRGTSPSALLSPDGSI